MLILRFVLMNRHTAAVTIDLALLEPLELLLMYRILRAFVEVLHFLCQIVKSKAHPNACKSPSAVIQHVRGAADSSRWQLACTKYCIFQGLLRRNSLRYPRRTSATSRDIKVLVIHCRTERQKSRINLCWRRSRVRHTASPAPEFRRTLPTPVECKTKHSTVNRGPYSRIEQIATISSVEEMKGSQGC